MILRGVRLSDAGDFVCVADNAAGQARKMFRLDVMGLFGNKLGLGSDRFREMVGGGG